MNLGHLLEKTYEALGFVKLKSVATGGSATTIVDIAQATQFGTNSFKKHIFFISQTTDGLTPQNKFGVLPAAHYVSATQTFTIPTVTQTVDAGDIYTIVKPTIGLYEMISQINTGMAMLPAVRLPNETLTTISSQSVYSIPLAAAHYSILEVLTGNDADGWARNTTWQSHPSAAGATPDLVFQTELGDGDTIKIIYLGKQTALSVYSDAISEQYPDELVYAACAFAALRYYMTQKGLMINRRWTPVLEAAKERWNRALMENPVRNPPATRQRTFEFGRM